MASHLIDTNSLLNLALYYHPFDAAGQLYKHAEARFNNGDWLLLESVRTELVNWHDGITLARYPFLKQIAATPSAVTKHNPPTNAQLEKIRNEWVSSAQARQIKAQYSSEIAAKLTRKLLQQAINGTLTPKQNYAAITANIERQAKADAERKYARKLEDDILIQLDKADFQLTLTAKHLNATIVTEETPWPNDGKHFKKIPAIAKIENIPCITLPELLKGSGIPLTM